MGEWQAIETAPKNGTLILVHNGDIFMLVFYVRDRWVEWGDGGVKGVLNLTHCVPLPEPPK